MGVAFSYTTPLFKGLPGIAQVICIDHVINHAHWMLLYYRERLHEGFHITSTHNGHVSLCVELSMKVRASIDCCFINFIVLIRDCNPWLLSNLIRLRVWHWYSMYYCLRQHLFHPVSHVSCGWSPKRVMWSHLQKHWPICWVHHMIRYQVMWATNAVCVVMIYNVIDTCGWQKDRQQDCN